MSEHVSRITAPWSRGVGAGAWDIARPTIPAGWANPIIALLAVVAILGAAVANPAAHPVLVSAIAAVAVSAMTVVRRLEETADRVIVVLGEDRPVARIAQVLRTQRPAFAFSEARPVRIRRAATWAEAARLVASSACQELVFAGSAFAPAARLVDATGRPVPIVTGAEAVQRRLGLAPLDLVGQDRWFGQLGGVRPLGALYAAAKRAMDVAAALVVGLLMLPLLPVVALAIRLESPGPVFYSQTRVGLGGRRFRIVKFRSMRQDAERDGARWAQAGDARITKVGRFMRLTRIDELPQVWNVLKGEMTLVGPRPERPEFTETLEQEIPHYGKRLAVKPGLTGWAQVRFRYTSSVEDTARKLEYDLYYLKHASLLFDLRILVATIGVVLRKAGC